MSTRLGRKSGLSAEGVCQLVKEVGATATAKKLGLSVRTVFEIRSRWERKHNTTVVSGGPVVGVPHVASLTKPYRLDTKVHNGMVLVGSDAHYWPGPASTAHRTLVEFAKEYQPKVIVMNGDALDGASISRHPPIGWENRPALEAEIDASKERLDELMRASPNAELYWPLGNHDGRFSTRLAQHAPEYAKVHGFELKDHFPYWHPCWSVWINNEVVVKHRFKGGIHARHNNAVWAGKTIITGHLHNLGVTPFNDYNGLRWGVDTGMLADPDGMQFKSYTEDNPLNWRSGFIVLTFLEGILQWPEICYVVAEGLVGFRGKLIPV